MSGLLRWREDASQEWRRTHQSRVAVSVAGASVGAESEQGAHCLGVTVICGEDQRGETAPVASLQRYGGARQALEHRFVSLARGRQKVALRVRLGDIAFRENRQFRDQRSPEQQGKRQHDHPCARGHLSEPPAAQRRG